MNKMTYPEIRIKNAWLIYENVSVHLHKLWGKNKKLATHKEIDKIVALYQKAWKPYEKIILEGMQKILGLKFNQNIIDVHVAPWFSAFSDPMVIGIRHDPDYFIDVLTHELLHRLLTDNTKSRQINLLTKWKKLFGAKHSFGTTVHIPVHAVHKAIFLDILKEPNRFEREVSVMKDFKATDYLNSLRYVEQHDYKELIKQIKSVYKKVE